jgi:hypothetical protein
VLGRIAQIAYTFKQLKIIKGAEYFYEKMNLTMRDFITVWEKHFNSLACLFGEMYSDPIIRGINAVDLFECIEKATGRKIIGMV